MRDIIIIVIFCMGMLCGCKVETLTQDQIANYMNQAEELYKVKNEEESDLMIEKAIEIAEQEYGDESEAVANVLLDSVDYATEFTRTQKRIERAEKIYELYENKSGIARVNYCYGELYSRVGGKEKANEYYEKALKYCGNADNDLKYDIYVSLGVNVDSIERGLELLKKAEEVYQSLPEEKQEKVQVFLYMSLGRCYFKLKGYENAVEYYDMVINNSEENSLEAGRCYNYRGASYSGLGNYPKAIEDISHAIILLNRIETASLWDRATAYCYLSAVYTIEDVLDYDKAFEYGLESCRIYNEKSELSTEELEELKALKDVLKRLYEESPKAQQQDFEPWYKENINK